MTLLTCVMAWAQNNVRLEYGNFQQDFTTLQDAFNALPPNSTPATVTLLNDVSMNFEKGNYVTVPAYSNVTVELNGYVVSAKATGSNNSCVIWNNGTLTIEDHSAGQTGKITSAALQPDDGSSNPYGYPGYGGYTIVNKNTFILNSGTIENATEAAACNYVVQNMPENNKTSRFIMNGGKVIQNGNDDAIRLWANYANATAIMEVNAGEIISQNSCVFIHGDGGDGYVSLTVNGGIWRPIGATENEVYTPGDYRIIDCLNFKNNRAQGHVNIVVNDGDFYGMVYTRSTGTTPSTYEHIEINGGRWHGIITGEDGEQAAINPVFVTRYDTDGQADHYAKMITGGTIDSPSNEAAPQNWLDNWNGHNTEHKIWGYYVAEGFCATDNGDGTWTIGACGTATYTASETVAADVDYSTKDVTVENNVTVTIPEDKTMEVHSLAGEGQIVVKDGATLVIGNGGLKSENDNLTQVIVEAGGTIAIGNGGITKQGEATPIEIQSDGNKSGVLLIDPNAPAAVAQAPAKVKVYTRAHKDNGIEYWQQFASPVKGNMTITPLGVGQEDGVYTSIYGWDYSADEWVRVPGMPVDLGSDVTAFGKTGWSGNNILAPFAAYNLINNSLLNEGGITYEFAGELVGNDDMVLTFPANGFCVFGNSYTAPIDLTTLFDQIQNDMSLDNIDAVVYIYNSVKDRFDAVNALTLELDSWGFADAPFTQIPPQQAFVMNLLAGGSAQTAVDYAKSVWGNQQANKNTPILAPKRVNNTISAALNIQVTDGEATDRVVLVEDSKYSEGYDRGADAEKYMNANFNIYANAAGRDLAMVATDDMEGTELTFAAGNAVNYTMTFANVEGEYVLVDNLNNNQIAIAEGGTYTFAAQPKSTVAGRFAIVPMAKMPTAIENTEVKANVKGIYSITGMYLGEDFKALPAGVYVVDGVKIVK